MTKDQPAAPNPAPSPVEGSAPNPAPSAAAGSAPNPAPSAAEGSAPNPAPSAVEGSAPNQRTFSLNSREFYEAVTEPPDPWVWAGGLPREPRIRERQVIIEPSVAAPLPSRERVARSAG